MSKICRTCLQTTDVTFSVNHLHEFGDNIVKISYVLRYCVPELYLGLSTNPEICYNCKRQLETAYLFKKECLRTEQILGNYLKSVRCTGKSIDLNQVLPHIGGDKEATDTTQDNVVNAEDIIAEWEDPPDEEGGNDLDIPLMEVRQSAPNPNVCLGNIEPLSPTQIYGEPLQVTKYVVNNKKYFAVLRESINKTYAKILPKPTSETSKPSKIKTTKYNQSTDNEFPKITSVFSLSNIEETPEDDAGAPTINDIDNVPSDLPKLDDNADTLAEVKTEPIDIEHNRVDFAYHSTDEETLDASETASYENAHCDSALQDIIDSIPTITDSSQYVDIPDLVQINNFGPRELEELRQQQLRVSQNDTEEKNGEIATQVDSSLLKSMLISDTISKGDGDEQNKILEVAGKVMGKYNEGYRMGKKDPSEWTSPDFEEPSNSVAPRVDAKSTRLRRRLKLKPVEYKFALSGRKNILADTFVDEKAYSNDDKDVVVLFTNYTLDGRYVNDHDYMVNPYRRNKILINSNGVWLCMCYICNYEHRVSYHIRHMNIHGSVCKVCGVDMGTPFMLNGHVRSHVKICSVCKQHIPYGLIDLHQCQIIDNSKYRAMRRGRRKLIKEEKPTGVSRVCQEKKEPISPPVKQECEETNVDTAIVKEQPIETVKKLEISSTPRRRGRKRKIKIEECSPSEVTCRVLRSMPRKWYSEADVELGLSGILEDVSHSKDPP